MIQLDCYRGDDFDGDWNDPEKRTGEILAQIVVGWIMPPVHGLTEEQRKARRDAYYIPWPMDVVA